MAENNIGFYQEPKNGNGIIRARTTLQIRSWDIPRKQQSLERFNTDIGKTEFPGLYMLFAKNNKVYVGEAKNLYIRIKTHMNNPDDKIKEWERAFIVNDGRPAAQSDFNDTVVRKALEYYLIRLLKANKYNVVSQGESQILNSHQQHTVNSLITELDIFLKKKNVITKLIEEHGQEEVFRDELINILQKHGKKVTNWKGQEVEIDGVKTFVRPGSKKPRGWQITIRGRKPGSFIYSFKKGNGFLLIPRNGVILIPLEEVQKVIKDKTAYNQDTIDIWIMFGEEKITLSYKDETIDITRFRLIA